MLEYLHTNSSEIGINLVASVPFFLLDTIIIALLVPVSLWFMNNRRWRPIRRRFIGELMDLQRNWSHVFGRRLKDVGDRFFGDDDLSLPELQRLWASVFGDADQNLRKVAQQLEADVSFYSMALTPKVATALLEWRQAMELFATELQSTNIDLWNDVVGGHHQRLADRQKGHNERFASARSVLVEATDRLLDSDNLRKHLKSRSPHMSHDFGESLSVDTYEYFLGGASAVSRRRGGELL
mgnify:CR=1 FL=1